MTDPNTEIFRRAADQLGKTTAQLEVMARGVLASMLHHAMENPGKVIWSVIKVDGREVMLEVDVPRRQLAQEQSST